MFGSVVRLYSRELFRRVAEPTADEDICEGEGHDGGDGKGEEWEEGALVIHVSTIVVSIARLLGQRLEIVWVVGIVHRHRICSRNS